MNVRPSYLLSKYMSCMEFSLHQAMMHYKLEQISAVIKGIWLDIGAGDQPFRKYFSGADEYWTTNTKRHYHPKDFEKINKLTTFWIEDGKTLPVPDNSLDGVACFQVLSVIDKPEDFFREINRVLKSGGKLILTTDFLYPTWSKEDRYRHTAFSLEQLSESTGLRVETIESFGGFGSTVYKLCMRFIRTFPSALKRKPPFSRIISSIACVILSLLIPLLSLIGILIFTIERKCTWKTDFTFNLLLLASKDPT